MSTPSSGTICWSQIQAVSGGAYCMSSFYGASARGYCASNYYNYSPPVTNCNNYQAYDYGYVEGIGCGGFYFFYYINAYDSVCAETIYGGPVYNTGNACL